MAKKTTTKQKKSRRPSFFKKHRKVIIIVLAVWAVLMLVGGGLLIYRAEMEKKAVEDTIASCIDETKKNPLGFTSECYEKNDREIPADVRDTDKARVDRILAQDGYDKCMAYVNHRKDALWDLNDESPQNGKSDGSYRAAFVDTQYKNDIASCERTEKLIGTHEDNFKTEYDIVLVGWREPKSDKIVLADIYNADGLKKSGVTVDSDGAKEQLVSEVKTVGGGIAEDFKNKHLDWWY